MTLMPVPMASNEQKVMLLIIWLSWPQECIAGIENTITITWGCGWSQWHPMTKKVMMDIILIILTWGVQWHHWWCCPHHMLLTPIQWHHMIATPMPVALCDMHMFMSLASCDKEKSCCTLFQLSWPKECSCNTDDVVGMMWHWYQCQSNTVVTLLMPLASFDANSSANVVP